MSERHAVPAGFAARIGAAELQALREDVAVDPDAFWLRQAKRLDWVTKPTVAGDWRKFYANVADVLTNHATPLVNLDEMRRVIRVMEAAIESGRTGQVVAV